MKKEDLFEHKSKNWDLKSRRVKSAKAIATAILNNIELDKNMHIMDFGAGTGLLSYFLSNYVGKITAVDNSPSMLEVFKEKSSMFDCPIEILEINLTKKNVPHLMFDGIVSSMTIHHIEHIEDIFQKMYNMLPKDGFIALADLDIEDGSFHNNNRGVFHFGFNRDELGEIAKRVGFQMLKFETIHKIKKPHKDFFIFLMCAKK